MNALPQHHPEDRYHRHPQARGRLHGRARHGGNRYRDQGPDHKGQREMQQVE
ncbi:hypothetical protein [Elstera litoralis]|uniref:hypothetical protein n=1 Tax=Elstera litoralis TaxID=552518 RepID=UPI0018DBB592|nr:hypothetical protein [Elstera litoralis]